jgi:hypothetical protein
MDEEYVQEHILTGGIDWRGRQLRRPQEGYMGNVLVGGIYVVQAKKDDKLEYWAAATIPDKAVAAVEKEVRFGLDRNSDCSPAYRPTALQAQDAAQQRAKVVALQRAAVRPSAAFSCSCPRRRATGEARCAFRSSRMKRQFKNIESATANHSHVRLFVWQVLEWSIRQRRAAST